MITVDNVFLKYRGAKEDTIHGVTFDVKQGEIFGFLGPSGAGKSTLQKILTGVLRDYRGSVHILDTEVKLRGHHFYEDIGVDFEFPNFYSKCTALENLNYFASLYKNKHADPRTLLERVGLEKDADKKVAEYSKGMKMRLGFIRALLHDPKILFLDEPTSGLDPSNARTIKDMIVEQKNAGKTIILTTHNMHDAAELCDRVAFIVDGQVKAMNTPAALQSRISNTQVKYSFEQGGQILEKQCLLAALQKDADFVAALAGGGLMSIHSKEQTLEDVFIELTGRCLE